MHSRRALAIHRSQIAFARRLDRRPDDPHAGAVKTASNASVYLASRSLIRNLRPSARSSRSMSMFRACCTVQAAVGWAVTPASCTRRSWCSMTYRRLRNTVSACKKSHDRIQDAWEVRNCRQVGDVRRGAGLSPAAARIRRIVPSPMRWPRPRSSPWMRRCPQRGFCLPAVGPARGSHPGSVVVRWCSGRSICSRPGAGARRAGCAASRSGAAEGGWAVAAGTRRSGRGRPSPASVT